MRLPDAAHDAHRWRIHDIVPDFTVEALHAGG
jgi:hypothetical protein